MESGMTSTRAANATAFTSRGDAQKRRRPTVANETVITIIGHLASDPELRWAASGAAVANFRVLSTPKTYDKASGKWEDGETLGLNCSIWREAAENVAESLTMGTRVIVSGRLTQRSYENREGQRQTVVELQVDEVGPSLKYATAKVTKADRRPSFAEQQQARREIDGKDAYGRNLDTRPGGRDDPWASEPAF